MQRHDKILVAATIGLLAYTCLLSFLGPVVSSLVANKTLGNTGSVRAIGVNVYWNYTGGTLSNPVTSFSWGMLDPNSTKTLTCYVNNGGNSVLTLSMTMSNPSPSNALQYMKLSWNLGGQTLNAGQTKQAIFTLQIFANATSGGITNFSFDVTIIGTS
jgi:hypothetical protein